jgi:rhodanese-related sulfurtransferase
MTTYTAAGLVAEAKDTIENLTVDEFASQVDDPDSVIVDLREANERAESGGIPGAVHAPRGMIEFHADPTSPYHLDALAPSKRVLLYCASGGRSALAAATLRSLGYADVAHLDGGFKAWLEAGRPVERV